MRQFAEIRNISDFWFLVLSLSRPLRPPLRKNPLQKLFAGLVGAAFAAGQGGFGFYEAAFDGGFEDGGFVAFEVGFDALAVGDCYVEAGELFFESSATISRCTSKGTRWKPECPSPFRYTNG